MKRQVFMQVVEVVWNCFIGNGDGDGSMDAEYFPCSIFSTLPSTKASRRCLKFLS